MDKFMDGLTRILVVMSPIIGCIIGLFIPHSSVPLGAVLLTSAWVCFIFAVMIRVVHEGGALR